MPTRSAWSSFLALTVILFVVACDAPTRTDAEGESDAAAADYDAVLAEIDGLEGQARWDRLVELAEAENGTFEVYGTLVSEQIAPLMEDFVEATESDDIEVSHYRSGSVEVLERLLQEAEAGQPRADAVITIAMDLHVLSDEGLLEPFDTPVTDDVSEELVFADWAGVYVNVYALARNTDRMDDRATPATWKDVLEYGDQPVGIEVQAYDWFTTLVTQYFMAEHGLTEEQAVRLFTDADADLVPVHGRNSLVEFTAAGEYALSVGGYTQLVDAYGEDAPIDWEPPVEPLVQRPNGVAPIANSSLPATALLFVDYLLSERGQEMLSSFSLITTNVDVDGALPEEYDVVTVDVDEMVENREKWTDLFGQVTGEPVTE